MMPTSYNEQAPVPPPSYHRREVQAQARRARALHLNALTLIETLHLLALCRLAVQLAHRRCPPPLAKGAGGRPRTYRDESLLLIALLKTLWRLSYQDVHDWLASWPALASACGLPLDADGKPCVPSPSHLCKRWQAAGAPPFETLFVLTVWRAVRCRLIGARDLIIDSAPILAWRRTDPDAAPGHAPAHHPRPLEGLHFSRLNVRATGHAPAHHPRLLLRGYRVHTLLCRGSGLPVHFLLSPANCHDAPFARPLLELAVRLYGIGPRIIRLDAAYWGLQLLHWIHATLGAVAVVPWNPKRQKNRSCLSPTWTKEELGKRSSIERFFGRVFLFFRRPRPAYSGWSTIVEQVALTYTASIVVALAAWQAHRPDLIRSPKRVLAHLWEDSQL